MNTTLTIPLPTQFHEELKEKRTKLLEDALSTIQNVFDSKNYSIQDPNEDNPIKLQLFVSKGWAVTMQDNERKSNFSRILSDSLFPQDEFDKNLAQFNWKLIDEGNTYYLIEIK